MTNLLNNYFCVPVPEDAFDFECNRGAVNKKPNGMALHYELKSWPTAMYKTRIDLPPGKYVFIATDDQITEEQAGEIVDIQYKPFSGGVVYGFSYRGQEKYSVFKSALAAVTDLLRSKSIQGRVAVVKKVNV